MLPPCEVLYTTFGSFRSCCVTKPSPPPTLNHMPFVMGPWRRRLGPHQEPLSCRPPQTRYGTAMSNETLYGCASTKVFGKL